MLKIRVSYKTRYVVVSFQRKRRKRIPLGLGRILTSSSRLDLSAPLLPSVETSYLHYEFYLHS